MAVVPQRYRASIRQGLADLVAGTRPELLTWVNRYGEQGAVLIPQPEEIWTHNAVTFVTRPDGSASVVLPLWTTDESPSDLSAEVEIDADGIADVVDVHVL